ncbi:hypothetical protein PHSC3_000434 [Chlamydiales bacterium STE3]|nr:hypothetical protein PHSC3_000434 [Chlamydiales bacterium STE3]
MKKLFLILSVCLPSLTFSAQISSEESLSYSYEDRKADILRDNLRRDTLRRENLRSDLRNYYQRQDNRSWDIKKEQTEEDRLRDQQLKEELRKDPDWNKMRESLRA